MWLTEKLQQGASSMHRPASAGSSEAEIVMEGTYFSFWIDSVSFLQVFLYPANLSFISNAGSSRIYTSWYYISNICTVCNRWTNSL